MSLMDWLLDQKLSDWVQGLGSLAAAGAAVGIALRQENSERLRTAAAQALRRQVLAAAIAPVLGDLRTTARFRSGIVQALGRQDHEHAAPNIEELLLPLPEIFTSTIDRVDVFGAYIAARMYTLVHRVNDYNRNVHDLRSGIFRTAPGALICGQNLMLYWKHWIF